MKGFENSVLLAYQSGKTNDFSAANVKTDVFELEP